MREEIERSAPRLARVVARAEGPEERVRAWITALIGAATDPARVHRAHLFTELTPIVERHHGSLQEEERELWRPLLEAIEAGYADGVFRGGDPASDALLVYDLAGARLVSALHRGARDRRRADRDHDRVCNARPDRWSRPIPGLT